MKKKKNSIGTLVVIIIVLAVIIRIISMIGNSSVINHNSELKKAIMAVKDKEVVTLDEIIPFEWEMVYTFDPYTSKEEIEEMIGFISSDIKETVNEGMVQLLFVKDKKVVASVCAYASSLGYEVRFKNKVDYGNGIEFDVKTESGVVSLTER